MAGWVTDLWLPERDHALGRRGIDWREKAAVWQVEARPLAQIDPKRILSVGLMKTREGNARNVLIGRNGAPRGNCAGLVLSALEAPKDRPSDRA